jgi:hypothetical protein
MKSPLTKSLLKTYKKMFCEVNTNEDKAIPYDL